LDQHENEEDATNVEHEGNVSEEEEENVEQALVDTLSALQVRRGHGPNKLPSGRFVITVVNEVVDPTQPPIFSKCVENISRKTRKRKCPYHI
jgi:hypothetical protein